jgi:hypothetical protein
VNVRMRSSLAHQGRLPAFVYARHNHLLLNKEIIRQGHWHTYPQYLFDGPARVTVDTVEWQGSVRLSEIGRHHSAVCHGAGARARDDGGDGARRVCRVRSITTEGRSPTGYPT